MDLTLVGGHLSPVDGGSTDVDTGLTVAAPGSKNAGIGLTMVDAPSSVVETARTDVGSGREDIECGLIEYPNSADEARFQSLGCVIFSDQGQSAAVTNQNRVSFRLTGVAANEERIKLIFIVRGRNLQPRTATARPNATPITATRFW